MNKDEYNYMRKRFLQDSYDTPECPASVARAMMDKEAISIFIKEQGQSFNTNIKSYIRWLRKLRDKRMFIGNMHNSKPSKFVSVFGLQREMNLDDLLKYMARYE